MKEPIVFKCEASLWDMLARGEKTWDARRYDMADDRIYRLAWGSIRPEYFRYRTGPTCSFHADWVPEEQEISFLKKATGEILTFQYLGKEFTPRAPGWCFLLLGERIEKGGKA